MESKNLSNQKVIVRFPPSPTGLFHIGNARTFLFNYLFAKQNDGQIVFRLEDTDKERSKEEYAQDIIENLKWLGIEPDFSTLVRQSERTVTYQKYLEKLIAEDKAYFAEERKEEAEAHSTSSGQVIRFRNPNKKITFYDLIRGDITFDTTELKDFVIAKSLTEPIYHLAVVIDDFEMGVTHILRGDDGISNTPRQILIQEAIGAERPIYAHLPLMLAPDQTKLSKRKHGEQVSVSFYRNAGYLPEAVINFLAMIGWNAGDDQEIFSMPELIEKFNISKVQKKSGIFNIEKLNWLNKSYILCQSQPIQIQNLKDQIKQTKFKTNEKLNDETFITKFLKLILERIHRWSEVKEILEAGEFHYLFENPILVETKILWQTQTAEEAQNHLTAILSFLDNKEKIMSYAETVGKGNLLWPLRYSLSGEEKSPDPFTLISILGVSEATNRIKNAIQILQKNKN